MNCIIKFVAAVNMVCSTLAVYSQNTISEISFSWIIINVSFLSYIRFERSVETFDFEKKTRKLVLLISLAFYHFVNGNVVLRKKPNKAIDRIWNKVLVVPIIFKTTNTCNHHSGQGIIDSLKTRKKHQSYKIHW